MFRTTGFASPAEEFEGDEFDLERHIFASPDLFPVRMSGEAMIGASILAGDFVLIRPGQTPRVGEIVWARVDDRQLLRFYRKDRQGKPYLRAAHPDVPDDRPHEELLIYGVATAILRDLLPARHP